MELEIVIFVVNVIIRIMNIGSLFVISVFLIALIPMVILPFTFCQYIRIKHQAERQKQWIVGNTLYVEKCFDNGWVNLEGYVYHTQLACFDSIEDISTTRYNIVIRGRISITEQYNGRTKSKIKEVYKIPRVFINENELFNLKGDMYVR